MRFMLRYRFPEGGEGEGGGTGNGDAGAGGSGAGGGGGTGAGGEKPVPVTFASQADLDAVITARVARAEQGAALKVATDAGFPDVAAMHAAAKAGKEASDASLTAVQRAEAAAAAATAQAAEHAQALDGERVANAFTIAALKADIPADRLADALALADRSLIVVKDGAVTGVDEAVAALVKDKPWVIGKAAGANGGVGGGANGGARSEGEAPPPLSAAAAAMARNFGLDPARVAEAAMAKPGSQANVDYVARRMKETADALKK